MNNQPHSQMPPPVSSVPTSTLALVSMIAGIAGWLAAPLIGPLVAIISGHMAKREIRESMGQKSGDGMATAGLVLGYLQLVPALLCICAITGMLVMGIGVPFLDSFNF